MYKTLPQMIYKKSQDFPELNIQFSKNTEGTFLPITYKDFVNSMLDFSAGLLSIGETYASLVISNLLLEKGYKSYALDNKEIYKKNLITIKNLLECIQENK